MDLNPYRKKKDGVNQVVDLKLTRNTKGNEWMNEKKEWMNKQKNEWKKINIKVKAI